MGLPDTVAAVLAGKTVRAALLLELQFASGTERIWTGFGQLTTNDARVWKGTAQLVNIDGLDARTDTAAVPTTLTLSGVAPELIAAARNSAAEAKGRPCIAYLQFFDDAFVPLDQPIVLRSGLMDVLTYQATGPDQRQISLTVEGLFVSRVYSPFAYWTDRDQQARFAGDLGMQFVPSLQYMFVVWPG